MLMFDEDHASRFGLKEAIILHKIIFYVLLNKKDGRNLRRGKYWTYNGRRAWCEVFPCFSHMQIWRSFKRLEGLGALVSDSFNKKGYDKTRWYTLSDSMMSEVATNKYWSKAVYKNETPIPFNNNIIKVEPY